MSTFLPYGRQHIDDDDIAAVARVLRGDWLTTGPTVAAFEQAFARAVGAEHAVAVCNGTAALHLAALAAGLGPGSRVLVPAITFVATANGPHYAGADVVVADVDPHTGLLTPETVEAAVASGPFDAVMPVHLNGQVCDMESISRIAAKAGAVVIEDACHALGGEILDDVGRGWSVGSCRYGRMTTFSLHPVKIIAAGEGGVITTNDSRDAEQMLLLRSHAMERNPAKFTNLADALDEQGQPNPWYSEVAQIGFNYRLSDIHAALALSQLGKLNQFARRREELVQRYRDALAPLAPIVTPLRIARDDVRPGWHLFVVQIDFKAAGVSRAKLANDLRNRGIGTQVHYLPLNRQPYFVQRYGSRTLPGADAYYERVLSLPLFAGMSDGDVDSVVRELASALGLGSALRSVLEVGPRTAER